MSISSEYTIVLKRLNTLGSCLTLLHLLNIENNNCGNYMYLDEQKYKPVFESSCVSVSTFMQQTFLKGIYCQHGSCRWYSLKKKRKIFGGKKTCFYGVIFDSIVSFCNQFIARPKEIRSPRKSCIYYQLFGMKYTQISKYTLTLLVYYKGEY